LTARIARPKILKEAKDEKKGHDFNHGYCPSGLRLCNGKKPGSALEFNQHLAAATKYFQQENYSLARQELNLALSIDSKSVRANNIMGLTYLKRKTMIWPKPTFRRRLKLIPNMRLATSISGLFMP